MVCQALRIIWTNSSKWFGAFKYNIFPRKCFVVTSSYSDHVTTAGPIFTKITVFFLQNEITKFLSPSGQMVCHMLRIIWSVSSRWFGALKYNIFPRKCFVVTSSYSDHVTTAAADIDEDNSICFFKIKARKFIA